MDHTLAKSQMNETDPSLEFLDWGLIDYDEALKRQLELLEKVSARSSQANSSGTESSSEGYLVFCSHPPVVTLGRATQPGDVFAWNGPLIEVSRGGRATYHGPSQLVVYPIVDLRRGRKGRGPQEVQGFLRDFEASIVEVLNTYGLNAQGKSLQKRLNQEFQEPETGVWLGQQKVASLGLAIKKWVTYHGAAINLHYDPEAFVGMNPCGFSTSTMISLEQAIGKKVDEVSFKNQLRQSLLKSL